VHAARVAAAVIDVDNGSLSDHFSQLVEAAERFDFLLLGLGEGFVWIFKEGFSFIQLVLTRMSSAGIPSTPASAIRASVPCRTRAFDQLV
jgi:hypothetical protein